MNNSKQMAGSDAYFLEAVGSRVDSSCHTMSVEGPNATPKAIASRQWSTETLERGLAVVMSDVKSEPWADETDEDLQRRLEAGMHTQIMSPCIHFYLWGSWRWSSSSRSSDSNADSGGVLISFWLSNADLPFEHLSLLRYHHLVVIYLQKWKPNGSDNPHVLALKALWMVQLSIWLHRAQEPRLPGPSPSNCQAAWVPVISFNMQNLMFDSAVWNQESCQEVTQRQRIMLTI